MSVKTQPTSASVDEFLGRRGSAATQRDSRVLVEMMEAATGAAPVMWGTSIVGFGSFKHRNTTGSYDWLEIGFAPRAKAFALYGLIDFAEADELLSRLGTHDTGVGCLYIKRLADIDMDVLAELAQRAVARRRAS